MSTKIYNAFKLKSTISLVDLSDFLKEAKSEIDRMLCQNLAKVISEKHYYEMDSAELCGASECPPLADRFVELEEDIRKGLRRNLVAENSCQIIPHNGQVYLISFIGPPEIRAVFHEKLKNLGFDEYEYWDNADRPDDVSELEWLERKKLWDEIFESSSIPLEHGLSKVFSTVESCIMMLYKISEERDSFIQAPTKDLRFRNLFDDAIDERAALLRQSDPRLGTFSGARQAQEYFDADEAGIAERKALFERYEAAIEAVDARVTGARRVAKP